MADLERFYSKVAINPGGCWLWTGATDKDGYGIFHWSSGSRKMGKAHRWMATQQYGEIPAGMVVDHRCRNKSCVCPRHLEVVSVAENNRRIYADKTLCNYGHPLDGVGVKYKRRWCNTCNRERQRRRRATKGGQ